MSLRLAHAIASPAEAGVPEPSDEEFELFRGLVERESGIHLSPSKRALLYGRLARRVRELGLPSFTSYYRRIVEPEDEGELAVMIDRITTNETHFFREPHHFEYLRRTVVPEWIASAAGGGRSRSVRIWSAACSTGEEPFSIGMLLLDLLSRHAWDLDVLATDLSTRALAAARAATWPVERAKEIPPDLLKRYVLRGIGAQSGRIRAGRELRDIVRFARFNLNDASYPDQEPFDLIFCRNVLIYFEPRRRQHVIDRLVQRLAPGGRLFLGHAEGLQGMSDRLRMVCPTVYARVGPTSPSYDW